ncbi:MAG: LysR family transcriptional regulator [Pseudomonadota bacterium]|nr:LysR family transcriptional regulator [Pseudomonadota bacterium]
MDRYTEMQIFVRVAESGSLSATAERMNIAKSAVSRRLAELESRLGVQLLHRTTRRISLTESGRHYFQQAQRLLADLEEVEQSVASEHTHLRGLLRLAVPLSFGIRHLAPLFDEFMLQHPDVQLELNLDDRTVNLLEEGLDLAIRIGMLADSTLMARRLATVQQIVCASPQYLEQFGEPHSPEELKQHAALNYSNVPESQLWQFSLPGHKTLNVRPRVRMRANNGDVLLQAAIDGLGILVSPDFICRDAIGQGLLRPMLSDYPQPDLHVYAIYPAQRHLPRRVRVLIDFLANKLQVARSK